ncbi:MAG: hypothetical protein IPG96_20115 [Proteobacteria bacterium]|nr:hypothetical protein [Pseudomonadota bacterium]
MPIDRVSVRVQRTRKRCQRVASQAAGLLSGAIEAIEELDRGDATYARLAATLLLQRPDGSVALRHDFDETRPCPPATPARSSPC